MSPYQKHYQTKMKRHGWMDESGNIVWPQDIKERQKMMRGLMGIELVGHVDYWTLLAEDELDDTYQAPSAKRVPQEAAPRREVFKTLNPEQRAAVRELLRYVVKSELTSFCKTFDGKLGSMTISIDEPDDTHGDRLEIHSPNQEELYHEARKWLEDFSIIFGQDERHEAEA